MNIIFVNHASFIISEGGVKIICDPWIEGSAFNNGWHLISKTVMNYNLFSDITHIWFSHEHPDHFAPQNLFKIPQEHRNRITILYQETTDKKVSEFCSKLGFKNQIELKKDKIYQLSHNVSVICNPYSDGDSYACFNVNGIKILNLNDCVVDSKEKALFIKEKIGEIDILFTQFGYANKIGNTKDTHQRIKSSSEKLQRIKYQNQIFEPKFIVPFASYIFFCHQENEYMNDGVYTIDKVHSYITNSLNSNSIVLYPGDKWYPQKAWDSTDSINKYLIDYGNLSSFKYYKSEKIEEAILISNCNNFLTKLISGYPKMKSFIQGMEALVYISDYNSSYKISGKSGLIQVNLPQDDCDISLSSDSLNYCFKELWGGDTMQVNARFQIINDYENFRKFGIIASALNRKENFPFSTPSFRNSIVKFIKSFKRGS